MYKQISLLVIAVLIALPAWAARPETEDQKTLYALGVHMTRQLGIFNLSAEEIEFVKQGMTDVIAGAPLAAEPESYMQKISQLAQSRMEASAKKQKELSQSYLEKAAAEPGVQKNRIRVDLQRN